MRILLRFLPLCVALMAYAQPAHADDQLLQVTAPTDYWLTFSETTEFVAYTLQDGQNASDPQLWLYDATGGEIASNDDTVGLQSRLQLTLAAGTYRLRAATCCGNPDGWNNGWGWNNSYLLTFTGIAAGEHSTTTTSAAPETTSTTSTTTSVPEPETTTTWPATVQTTTTTTSPTVGPSTTTSTTSTTSLPPSTTSSTSTTTSSTTSSTSLPSSTSTSSSSQPATTTSSTSSSTTTSTVIESTPGTNQPPTTVPEPTAPVTPDSEAQQLAAEVTEYLATIEPSDLEQLTSTEVDELIATIADAELTDDQAAVIAAVMTDAPDDVKQAFEDEINVFSGQFDVYVPVGSTVNVGQRRTLTAATAASSLLPGPVAVARKK